MEQRRIERAWFFIFLAAVTVSFLDMAEIGANPARIIGVWAAALEKHTSAGQQLRLM